MHPPYSRYPNTSSVTAPASSVPFPQQPSMQYQPPYISGTANGPPPRITPTSYSAFSAPTTGPYSTTPGYPGEPNISAQHPANQLPQLGSQGPAYMGGYHQAPPGGYQQQQQQPMYQQPQTTAGVFRQSPIISQEVMAGMSASSEFVRCTAARMPNSSSLKQKCHIPLGFVIRPLSPSAQETPEVNFGSTGKVIRCHRCRTYINPFITWESSGRRWTCNNCNFVNDCPQQYYCGIDEMGQRTDRRERPELWSGSVEFIAPSDYMARPPQPPTYLFLIDVSASSVMSGMLAIVCQSIKMAIKSGKIPGGARTQVGVITFDNTIHFYKLSATSSQPQMVVVPSLEDVFVPLPDDILVNLVESEGVLLTLLDGLPSMWSGQRIVEVATGSAIKAAHQAMNQWGGKLSVFMSNIPTAGELTLQSNRSLAKGLSAAEAEASLLRPLNSGYSQLATQLSAAQIAVDLYVCPSAVTQQQISLPMDLPTLSPISSCSAGEIKYYPCFNAVSSGAKLQEELFHAITRTTGWEAVMRIRASRGWKITEWFGHFCFRHEDLLVLPNCHEDQTFTISMEHEENVATDPYIFMQSALLYTNSNGERRIRVHTYCVPVVQSFQDVVGSIDEAAVMAMLTHQAISQATKSNLADARQHLQTCCSHIYSALSQVQNTASPVTMLPSYTLAVLKSVAFKDFRDVTPDLRHSSWLRIASLPLEDLMALFLPRLLSLHDMPSDAGTPDTAQTVILPPCLPLSAAHLSQAGVYLIENGEQMIMWIGKGVDPRWLQSVFGVDNIDHINPDHADSVIGTAGSELGGQVAAIVMQVRRSRLPFMRLHVIRQGMSLEAKFYCLLIEDRSQAMPCSYADFIQKISSHAALKPGPALTHPAGRSFPPQQGTPNLNFSQGYAGPDMYGKQQQQQQPQQQQPPDVGYPPSRPTYQQPPLAGSTSYNSQLLKSSFSPPQQPSTSSKQQQVSTGLYRPQYPPPLTSAGQLPQTTEYQRNVVPPAGTVGPSRPELLGVSHWRS